MPARARSSSASTIRRDLEILDRNGELTRSYGGAVLLRSGMTVQEGAESPETPYDDSADIDLKVRVAKAALEFVAPVLYGGATLVGLSRMYHNKHWASDVALGAAVGTFSGLKVVRYSHNHPDNRIDKLLLRTVVMPNGNGGELAGLSIPWSIGY